MSFHFKCFECPGNYKYLTYPRFKWTCPACGCHLYYVDQVDD